MKEELKEDEHSLMWNNPLDMLISETQIRSFLENLDGEFFQVGSLEVDTIGAEATMKETMTILETPVGTSRMSGRIRLPAI